MGGNWKSDAKILLIGFAVFLIGLLGYSIIGQGFSNLAIVFLLISVCGFFLMVYPFKKELIGFSF